MTSTPMIRIISTAEQHRGPCINDLNGLNGWNGWNVML
jgi:hypothetical protein